PAAASLIEVFEQQVVRRPDAIAASFQRQWLTYAGLNRQADILAQRLYLRGVGREVPIGIMSERSSGLLISMLATFKVGGVYVPLDPLYPPERIRQIVDLTKSRVILSSRESAPKLRTVLGAVD